MTFLVDYSEMILDKKNMCLKQLVTFMLSMVNMLLKGEVGGHALNDHGNYINDHGKSWKYHGILFFEFLWEPWICYISFICEKIHKVWFENL